MKSKEGMQIPLCYVNLPRYVFFFMNAQEFDLFDVGSMKFTTFQWGGPINSIQTSFVTNVKVMQQLA